jgi:ssDNA-binding Zn-finger/Zn-ribbon topoisomerase 1
MATCPDCDFEEIDADELEEGDALSCPECGRKLVLAEDGSLEFADGDDVDDDDDDDDEEDEDEEDDDDDDDDDIDDLDDAEEEDLDE